MQSKQEKKEKYIIIKVVLKWGFFSYMGQKWGIDPLFYGNGVGKWGLKSIIADANGFDLPLNQKNTIIGFAQASLNYQELKNTGAAWTAEHDVLAKALDVFRDFEHELIL